MCKAADLPPAPPGSRSDHDGRSDGLPGDVVTFTCHDDSNNNSRGSGDDDDEGNRRMLFSRCSQRGQWSPPGSCTDDDREEDTGSDAEPDFDRDDDDDDDDDGIEIVDKVRDEGDGGAVVPEAEVISGCPALSENYLRRLRAGETVVLQSEGFQSGSLSAGGRRRECRWKFVRGDKKNWGK